MMGMRSLGLGAAAVTMVAMSIGSASAAPALASPAGGGLVQQVQFFGPPPPPPPPYWGGRGFYGPRPGWGPPVVCRWRPTPWGPRRSCWRRW